MADQIAFMVMPFGRKKVGSERSDAPKEVDFDALWRNVHTPVLKGLGFRPIRADADLGALIVNEMVQRLTIADLVVADISLANANVYYEVGVRHAAKQRGCVLVAADWAQPVFDLQQMRRLRYPLTDGDCGRKAAAVSRKVLRTELPPLIAGESPVFGAVPGYPDKINPARITAFEDLVDLLSQFETEVTRINNTVDHEVRRQRTLAPAIPRFPDDGPRGRRPRAHPAHPRQRRLAGHPRLHRQAAATPAAASSSSGAAVPGAGEA